MKIINYDEHTSLGNFLIEQNEVFCNDNDSVQEQLISGLYPLISDLIPKGGVLEVGYGTNCNVMNFFHDEGYDVTGIDFNKKAGSLPGVRLIDGDVFDFNESGFGFIYFWGSWGSAGNNFTVGEVLSRPSCNNCYSKDFLISKLYSMLDNNGSLMFLSSDFACHGEGYGFSIDCVNDYFSLINSLSDAGFSEVNVVGLSKKEFFSKLSDIERASLNNEAGFYSALNLTGKKHLIGEIRLFNDLIKRNELTRERISEFSFGSDFLEKYDDLCSGKINSFYDLAHNLDDSDVFFPYLIIARK